MDWFWIALLIIFMFIFSSFINKFNYSNQECIDFKIKQPYWYLYVGILGVVGFNLIGMIFLFYQKEIISFLIMILISLPYILIVIYTKNWEIEFNENGFEYYNIWRNKKSYVYNDVDFINTGRTLKIYYKNKKVVAISFLLTNVDKFEKIYNKYLKKVKNIQH